MRSSRLSEITGQAKTPPSEARGKRPLLTLEEARILKAWLRSESTPPTVAARAQIIRFAAAGLSNSEIARELGVTRGTVILWRERFEREGLRSLIEVRPGRGRRPSVSLRAMERILGGARHGCRSAGAAPTYEAQAAACGVSAATVYRIWDEHGLAKRVVADPTGDDGGPHLRGLYLDPPDRALVATGRAPAQEASAEIPVGLARALDRFDRIVAGPSSMRDRERAFLNFLRRVERSTPGDRPLRLLVGRAGVHERPRVARWIRAHRRYRLEVVASSASARDLVAHSGAACGRRASAEALRLIDDLRGYLTIYDGDPDRFVWLVSES